MKCLYCEKEFDFIPTGTSGGTNRQYCYDCAPEGYSEQDKEWSKYLLKQKINQYKINRGCDICGYNKNPAALDWYHTNNDKDYNPASLLSKANWEGYNLYVEETKKCILLCANCHRELHNPIIVKDKPQGNNKYQIIREEIKEVYLKTKSIRQTAFLLKKDPESIKKVLNFYNIPLFYQNSGIGIYMIDKNSNQILHKFDSARQAADFIGVGKNGVGHIRDVCRGVRKTAYGYKWKNIIE